MAELADAHGSGPCESNFMEVRLLLPAPQTKTAPIRVLFSFVMKIGEESNLRRRERREKVRWTFEQRAVRSGRGPARTRREAADSSYLHHKIKPDP